MEPLPQTLHVRPINQRVNRKVCKLLQEREVLIKPVAKIIIIKRPVARILGVGFFVFSSSLPFSFTFQTIILSFCSRLGYHTVDRLIRNANAMTPACESSYFMPKVALLG